MKLIESERARAVSFSKRKKILFDDAKKFATQTGTDVGVMLFSPDGKPCSYGSTSVELNYKIANAIVLRKNQMD